MTDQFLTVRSANGAQLVLESTGDGTVSAWIAPPGESDGTSVVLATGDVQRVVAYLTARQAETQTGITGHEPGA